MPIVTGQTYTATSRFPNLREREAATIYCRGYDRDISDLGVETMQSQHRAALALLGVTFDTFVLERTKLPGVTALRFVSYREEEPGVLAESPVTTAVAPEAARPHPRALVEYVDKMCNLGRVKIMDEGEFKHRVTAEEERQRARMLEDHYRMVQTSDVSEYHKALYNAYRSSGQLPDDMADALAASQRYETKKT